MHCAVQIPYNIDILLGDGRELFQRHLVNLGATGLYVSLQFVPTKIHLTGSH